MSTENSQIDEPEQPRDEHGRFKPKTQTERNGQSQPRESDYTKMNSFMAKQLGLSDKIADYQMKFTPKELYDKLAFMMDNTTMPQTQPQGLPPNQSGIPIPPTANPTPNMPGIPTGKENLKAGPNFEIHRKIDLISTIKNKK